MDRADSDTIIRGLAKRVCRDVPRPAVQTCGPDCPGTEAHCLAFRDPEQYTDGDVPAEFAERFEERKAAVLRARSFKKNRRTRGPARDGVQGAKPTLELTPRERLRILYAIGVERGKHSILWDLFKFVLNFVEHNFEPLSSVPDFDEWIDQAPYTQARKDELRAVYAALNGGCPSRKQCSHIDSFIKSEAYDEFKEARWINSRHDAFKAWSGPWFHAMEKIVYQLPQFVKLVPVLERPSRIKELFKSGCFYYENDYKSFEAHITPHVMEAVELVLYKHLMKRFPDQAHFLCDVIKGDNRLHTRAGVSMTLRGRRMSGDMCTSLGNGFTNLMLFMFILQRKGASGDGFVEGDDGLFRTTVRLAPEDFTQLGFTVDIKELERPEYGHFCGMNMSVDGTIFKDPRRLFRRFYWTSSYINAGPKIMASLYRAKALSLASEAPGCPIACAMVMRALAQTRGVVVTHYENTYKVVDYTKEPMIRAPTEQARHDYAIKYGISEEAQLAVEAAIMDGDFDTVTALVPPTAADVAYYENYIEID